MTSSNEESKALVDELEDREAGVAELFEFYVGVEAVYAAAAKALEEYQSSMNSNSTNQG